jgi:hypothetical protein
MTAHRRAASGRSPLCRRPLGRFGGIVRETQASTPARSSAIGTSTRSFIRAMSPVQLRLHSEKSRRFLSHSRPWRCLEWTASHRFRPSIAGESSTLIGGHHEDPVGLLFPPGPCCLRGVRAATPHDRVGRRPCRCAEGLLQGRSLGLEHQRMRFAWRSRARHEFTQPEIGSRAEHLDGTVRRPGELAAPSLASRDQCDTPATAASGRKQP